MKSNDKRWALWGAGMGVAAAVAGGAFYLELPRGAQATEAASPAAKPAIPVTVAAVEPRDITPWQEFSGRLEAIDRVEVRPRVAGAIQSVHFREGALVKQGDLLVTIDPAPYEAAVAKLKPRSGQQKPSSISLKSKSIAAGSSSTTRRFRRVTWIPAPATLPRQRPI